MRSVAARIGSTTGGATRVPSFLVGWLPKDARVMISRKPLSTRGVPSLGG